MAKFKLAGQALRTLIDAPETLVTGDFAVLDGLSALTASAAELNQLDNTTLTAGITLTASLVKLTQTVGFAAFTDGGAAVGTFPLTVGTIPVGAVFLSAAVTAVTGFAGDESAALTIGDGTDVDRYNTSTVDVFTTAAGGVPAGIPSGVTYHAAAKTVTLTITTNADFTSVSAGSVTVKLFYLT